MFYEDAGAKVHSIIVPRGFSENVSKSSPHQLSWRKRCLSAPSGKCKMYRVCNQKIPPSYSALFSQVSDFCKVQCLTFTGQWCILLLKALQSNSFQSQSLKLAITRRQWAHPSSCAVSEIQPLFPALRLGSCLIDQLKCPFAWSPLNEEGAWYRATKSLCSSREQQKGCVEEKMMKGWQRSAVTGALALPVSPGMNSLSCDIHTSSTPPQAGNAFASYFHLSCNLYMLQPLWRGEAGHSNLCFSLVKAKLASLLVQV